MVAQVDDLLCVGSKEELENLRQLQFLGCECKGEMLGPDRGETRQVENFGRTIMRESAGRAPRGDCRPIEERMDLTMRHRSPVKRQNDSVKQALSSTMLLRIAQTSTSQAKKAAMPRQTRLLTRG